MPPNNLNSSDASCADTVQKEAGTVQSGLLSRRDKLRVLARRHLSTVASRTGLARRHSSVAAPPGTRHFLLSKHAASRSTRVLDIPKSECEVMYGPYPRSVPVPLLDAEGTHPGPKEIAAAATMWDVHTDYRDQGTPDHWIPRDGRLVRLTGRHPFNCEPPLPVLRQLGFLTPSCLHYVRNHGACPKLAWEEHTLSIGGHTDLVPRPFTLEMDELASMKPRELPVTLVCAGNRRKEQNMIRQSVGFGWGPSAISTNVWKGVLLRDLLLQAGVSDDTDDMEGKYVEFLGHEDLPNKVGPGPFVNEGVTWEKQVKYGTSVPLSRAMNPAYDILIAYQANGEALQPDHGYPVRLIIPGYIGGRMVKWLAKINVLPHETRNHYHYHDNRILPPHVTSEESLEDGWWYRPEYIFNELNINSAIAKPGHGEVLPSSAEKRGEYELAGYAYTGGGRKISRVEVTLDGGISWTLCTIHRREKPTPNGMYWCWLWWTVKVGTDELLSLADQPNGEIWCRAYDDSNNSQPTEMTWNLMGMGNNQVFRVKAHKSSEAEGGDDGSVWFEHPTQPGPRGGGWMTRPSGLPEGAGFGKLEREGDEEKKEEKAPEGGSGGKIISLEEVEKHNQEKDCWIILRDKVYDATQYLDLHPGGVQSILINAGGDATEDFLSIHSDKAKKMLEKFYLGDLDAESAESAKSRPGEEPEEEEGLSHSTDGTGRRKVALAPKRKIYLTLQSKSALSHDSFLLDFALPGPDYVLGLPTGKHVFVSATIDDKLVTRQYTPVTSDRDIGHVKFVIKAYGPTKKWSRGGLMSQFLDGLEVGDAIAMRGPVGDFEYKDDGTFAIKGTERRTKKFNMIAGGTGITPLLQVAAAILHDVDDGTEISLVYACQDEEGLLLKGILDEYARLFADKFRVHYVLSRSWPPDWKHTRGHLNRTVLADNLFGAEEDVYCLMCGPPSMLNNMCKPELVKLGHGEDRIFCF